MRTKNVKYAFILLFQPVWPGQCPGVKRQRRAPLAAAVHMVNVGVEHYELGHIGQAFQCWVASQRIFKAVIKHGRTALRHRSSKEKNKLASAKISRKEFDALTNKTSFSLDYESIRLVSDQLDVVSTNIFSLKSRSYLEMSMHEIKDGTVIIANTVLTQY